MDRARTRLAVHAANHHDDVVGASGGPYYTLTFAHGVGRQHNIHHMMIYQWNREICIPTLYYQWCGWLGGGGRKTLWMPSLGVHYQYHTRYTYEVNIHHKLMISHVSIISSIPYCMGKFSQKNYIDKIYSIVCKFKRMSYAMTCVGLPY